MIKQNMNELLGLRRRIYQREWLAVDNEKRTELIRRFFRGYIAPPLSLDPITLFRAQVNEDKDLFNNIKRLLAPPAHVVKKHGRLNRPHQPTLYMASAANAAIYELRPKLGMTVSVMACKIADNAPPYNVVPSGMSRIGSTFKLGPVSDLLKAGPLGNERFADILKQEGTTEQWIVQEEVLSHLLTTSMEDEGDEQILYEVINLIRELIYESYSGYDGFQYPCISTGLTGANIALDQKVWETVVPVEVWVMEVTKELYFHEFDTVLGFCPMQRIGSIENNGEITYRKTEETFLSALHNFKQKYGSRKYKVHNGQPMLTKPFARYRISYGDYASKVYDFLP